MFLPFQIGNGQKTVPCGWFLLSRRETLVFQLDDPPDAHETKVANLLDPFGYWLGYSPLDNTAYAVLLRDGSRGHGVIVHD